MGGPSSTPPDAPFSESDFISKIPEGTPEDHRRYYERLIPVLKARRASDKPRILVITDIEQDYDDLMAIIFLSEMHRLGVVELVGFIANHGPTLPRARFLRTIVHLLGLGHIEVAEGTLGVEYPERDDKARLLDDSYYELKNNTFDKMDWNNKPHHPGCAKPFRSGTELIEDLVSQVGPGKKEPLTVLLISSLQDISDYFNAHKSEDASYFQQRFKKFVSQGGYKFSVDQDSGKFALEPLNNMANNGCHETAAKTYTDCLVKYNLPSDAWSREAAKAAYLDGKTLRELTGNSHGPIGSHLNWLYIRQEFKFFWDPFNAPYQPRLDPQWYVTTRLCLKPDSKDEEDRVKFAKFTQPGFTPEFEQVLPYARVIAYDGCAAMGAVGDDVMIAMGIMTDEVPDYNKEEHRHRIFGRGIGSDGKVDSNDLGGVDGPKLARAFEAFFFGALRATRESAGRLINPAKVQHKEAERKDMIPLDVFDQQTPHIKAWNAMNAKLNGVKNQIKDLGQKAEKSRKEGEEAKAKALEESAKAFQVEADKLEKEMQDYKEKRLDGRFNTHPQVVEPKKFPYPLLFERAIPGGVVAQAKGGGG